MSLKLTTLVASDDALLGPLLQNGIRTGPDLTSYNAKSLFKHFPSGTATVYDIERLQSTVAQRMAAACTAGDDGMDATALAPLQTGVDALDALLKGFEAHDIFEIAGPRRSGKTVRRHPPATSYPRLNVRIEGSPHVHRGARTSSVRASQRIVG